jgi:hypothetical protein
MDALLVINDLNTNGARYLYGSAAAEGEFGAKKMLDVNGDRWATPLDALQAINAISRKPAAEGESGESGFEIFALLTPVTGSRNSPSPRSEHNNIATEAHRSLGQFIELVPTSPCSNSDSHLPELRDAVIADFDFFAEETELAEALTLNLGSSES